LKELLEDALAGREADVAELAEERAQVMLAAQGKTAPPAVLAARAAILGDAAAAASEPVEVGTTPDWLKPAEWFVGKRSSFSPRCDIVEKDGKVVRVEVPWVDNTTRERGSVWVTPQQLEAWPEAEEHYREWLLDWVSLDKAPLPLTKARVASFAAKPPPGLDGR
jgi:hypothetical protein